MVSGFGIFGYEGLIQDFEIRESLNQWQDVKLSSTNFFPVQTAIDFLSSLKKVVAYNTILNQKKRNNSEISNKQELILG